MKIAMLLLIAVASQFPVYATSAGEAEGVKFLNSAKVLPVGLPFSEAVQVDNMFYLSGQIGIQPGTMKLVPGGLSSETRQAMNNIKATLEANGLTMRDLVKCTVMLSDMSQWSAFNDVYKSFFVDRYPARSAMGVNGLALGAQVEIDCIAAGAGKH